MTTIEDLHIPSITNMSQDEAIEYLRQLRLARRTPVKRTVTSKKPKIPKMSTEQAAELLKILEG